MIDRGLSALREIYSSMSSEVIGLRFPLSYGPWTQQQTDVLTTLEERAGELAGYYVADQEPNPTTIHQVLHSALNDRPGWRIEPPGGPTSSGAIKLHREYGFNGQPSGPVVQLDGWHEESGTILEVEAGQSTQNNSILAKLTERGSLGVGRHFIVIVPWRYSWSGGRSYPFRAAIQPDYERLALSLFSTYTVIGVGGLGTD